MRHFLVFQQNGTMTRGCSNQPVYSLILICVELYRTDSFYNTQKYPRMKDIANSSKKATTQMCWLTIYFSGCIAMVLQYSQSGCIMLAPVFFSLYFLFIIDIFQFLSRYRTLIMTKYLAKCPQTIIFCQHKTKQIRYQ